MKLLPSLVLPCAFQLLSAQSNTITTAVPFLLISPDPRAGAMGDAGAATTPDVWSTHWNASKLAFAEERAGAGFSYTPWLRALAPGINLFYASAYFKPSIYGTLSSSFRYFSLGEITVRNATGAVIGRYKPYEWAADISYAQLLSNKFSMAIGIRYIYSDLTNGSTVNGGPSHPGQTIAADMSANYRSKGMLFGKPCLFSTGISISNIGGKITYVHLTTDTADFIPANLRIGQAADLLLNERNSLSFCLDLNKLLVPTPDTNASYIGVPSYKVLISSLSDAPGGLREELDEIMTGGGIEYWYGQPKTMGLRAGYFHQANTKGGRQYFTFGISSRYKTFQLDLSYLAPALQGHPLRNTIRFSLHYEFARKDTSGKQAGPE